MTTEAKNERNFHIRFILRSALLLTIIAAGLILSMPYFFAITENEAIPPRFEEFPVTVDPKNKVIIEDPRVNAYLAGPDSPLVAGVGGLGGTLRDIFAWIATSISDASWYQGVASVEGRLVTIAPGLRKEQVAAAFGKVLSWTEAEKKAFMTAPEASMLPLIEGSFSPGVYLVDTDMSPSEAQALVNDRFTKQILSRYGTTTAAMVPLDDAIRIASLIQRETIGTADMRLVSGVIWNRLFKGMNLQIDATVQYAKANSKSVASWWPKVLPADTRRRSPYNTYLNPGLPPSAIANPSVAAILAALNPIDTPCFFYFNDEEGNILCTNTYPEHVALLKKYYGRGK